MDLLKAGLDAENVIDLQVACHSLDLPPVNWSADYDSRTMKEEMWDAPKKAYGRRDYRQAS